MTDKAWKVGEDAIGYLIVKAPTRTTARMGFPTAYSDDAESWMSLRALRQPAYDYLPERDAQRQWETDMKAEFGPEWGES